MKKETINKHTKIANETMYYIYKYVDTEINLDELSCDLGVSKFHMHRIFKNEFGINIYESIKSIRLQKNSTITQVANFSSLTPNIVKMQEIQAYYVRHHGYERSIKESWQKLQTWALCNDVTSYTQIGVHHDNPTITPLSECNYIACISLQEEFVDASLPMFVIPSGVYARFDFSGEYGDVLKFMNWVYFELLYTDKAIEIPYSLTSL